MSLQLLLKLVKMLIAGAVVMRTHGRKHLSIQNILRAKSSHQLKGLVIFPSSFFFTTEVPKVCTATTLRGSEGMVGGGGGGVKEPVGTVRGQSGASALTELKKFCRHWRCGLGGISPEMLGTTSINLFICSVWEFEQDLHNILPSLCSCAVSFLLW